MKTIKTLFLLTLLVPLFGSGQTGNEYVLNIPSLVYYDAVYKLEPMKIQGNFDATIGGEFESTQSIVVVPKPGTAIRIVDILSPNSPPPPSPPGGGNGYTGGGGGTTIRSRPPIGPRMASTSTSDTVLNVTLFPNPVEKEFTLQLKNEKIIAFSIFDLSGNKKTDEKIEPSYEHKVDVSMLSEGTYILQIITEKNQYTSIQFIKK